MTVLLVEPSATFAQFLKLILTRLGYEVIHLAKTTNIREEIIRIAPDLIISEAVIGGMNGLEVCRLVRDDNGLPRVPVVIFSTDGCMETRQAAQQAGCVDYLTKPMTSRDIHAVMQRHLPFHHKRHGLRARMALTAVVSDGEQSLEQKIVNMGEGGLYMETTSPRAVGTKLDFEIPLPSLKKPVRLKGEVVYVKSTPNDLLPAGMGIKFIGMDDNTTTLLQHYMESYLSDFLPEPPGKS